MEFVFAIGVAFCANRIHSREEQGDDGQARIQAKAGLQLAYLSSRHSLNFVPATRSSLAFDLDPIMTLRPIASIHSFVHLRDSARRNDPIRSVCIANNTSV